MRNRTRSAGASWLVLAVAATATAAQAAPTATRTDIKIRRLLSAGTSAPHLVRIAKDPRNGTLYLLKEDGSILRLDLGLGADTSVLTLDTPPSRYSSHDPTKVSAQGFAIGPDGTFYVVMDTTSADGATTHADVYKGVPSGGGRTWSTLATTADYPRSKTAFDHVWNGIAVNPAGDHVYLNSGSRTDHGEVQDGGGAYPGLREAGLTAAIFELPTNAANLSLPNDRAALKSAGYVYAEGTRNSFDLTFAPNGDLLGTENGPDRDMPDELNFLERGKHYGFPWRIGGLDNPQQFPGYDPSTDKLLDSRFIAVQSGYYRNDPTFPPSPGSLTEPIANFGPDGDSYKDATGAIKDASALGQSITTFTPHRSPLGLVWVTDANVTTDLRGHAFVMGFTVGDATGNSVAGPFNDPSQDLLDLNLAKSGGVYTAHATRVVGGFSNPIDDEAIGNRVYVIEYGGAQGVYEISLPTVTAPVATPTFSPAGGSYAGAQTVTIATTTTGASIRYTTDGTSPTCATSGGTAACGTAAENSSATVSCPAGQTISSVTFASYGTPTGSCGSFAQGSCHAANSASVVASACVGKASCTVAATNAAFGDPCSGTFKSLAIQVQCGGGATNGTTYTGPVTVNTSETLTAIACASGAPDSAAVAAAYAIGTGVAAPTFTPAPGTYASAQNVTIATSTAGASIYYTTDGTAPACSGGGGQTVCATASEGSSATVTCPAGTTVSSIAFANYGTSSGTCPSFTAGSCAASNSASVVAGACVGKASCTVAATNATFGDPCSGTFKSLAIAARCGGGPVGTPYASPVSVAASETLSAIACKAGLADSAVTSGAYTIGSTTQVATPTFSPAPGAYASAQNVTLASTTSGATIRYTTDGSTPTCAGGGSSACGSGAENTNVTVSCPAGSTITAVTFASYGTPGGSCGSFTKGSCDATTSTSAVTSACVGKASCTVAATNATFGDPCSGTFKSLAIQVQCGSGAQTYAGPINVNHSETIKAIGCKSGLSDSAVASGSYTIAGSLLVDPSAFSDDPGAATSRGGGPEAAGGCSFGGGASGGGLALVLALLVARRRRRSR